MSNVGMSNERCQMDLSNYLMTKLPTDQIKRMTSDLAPTGRLRTGINYGNFLLANKDPVSGEPRGIAVELAQEIGRRLNVPVEFVTFETAGRMADAVKTGAWDIAFLANEPERANEISFTAPYLEIEASYLVPAGSPIRSVGEVDRDGLRVAISAKSAYDLFLSRTLAHATLVRTPGMSDSYDLFVAEKLEALAGIKPWLVMTAEKLPGSRVLDGGFMAVQQCIGTPRGRESGATYLREFVEDVKASGFLADLIRRLELRGVSIARS
jgi:polar amino acid transport system substrate-binding protein